MNEHPDVIFRYIGPASDFEHRLAEWIKYNGHRADAEECITAYRALHTDLCLIAAGESTRITVGPLDQGYCYDEHIVNEARRLGMMAWYELLTMPKVFEQPLALPLHTRFTAPPHLPTLWAKTDSRTGRQDTHYLWGGGCNQSALALWLWCGQDKDCFDYAVLTVWAEYATYGKYECGYGGETAKFEAALATAAYRYYERAGLEHPRKEVDRA